MHGNVQKWGNSLGVRIPMQLAKQLHLQPGSPVRIEIEEGRLIIQPPQYTLSALLEEITPQNMHHQFFADDPKGQEEW